MADNNYFSSLPNFDSDEKDKGKKRKRNLRSSDIDAPPAPSGVHKRKNAPKKPKETPVKNTPVPSATPEVQPSPSKRLRYAPDESRWLSTNPSKRWGELFFLYYSIVWISFFAVIVVFKIYELCGNYGYTAIGLIVSVPCFLYPLLFPGEFDRKIPLTQRYWFKANIWIAVISFIGNYFWTHYFYVVLKARYTFPTTWDLNRVPFYLYLITHAYFNTYHTFSNVLIRRFRTGRFYTSFVYDWTKAILNAILIGGFSITIAFMEAFSISSVPYYSYPDRYLMYTVGSMFYGIYFYVSFPMFFRLDEYITYTDNSNINNNTRKKNNNTNTNNKVTYNGWTVSQTFIDAMAACMLVTVILDLWRLALGPIIGDAGHVGVPFVY